MLTILKNKSIINRYSYFVFEGEKAMLKRSWKKIGMLILIIACIFNIMGKLVNKLSLNKEMLYSAEYMYEEQQNQQNQK